MREQSRPGRRGHLAGARLRTALRRRREPERGVDTIELRNINGATIALTVLPGARRQVYEPKST